MLTDTHCHLDFNKFDADRDEVFARAQAAGVARILIPGLSVASSRAAVKLAGSHPMLFAAVGVHPNEALAWRGETKNELRALVHSHLPSPERGAKGEGKIVAIGEIGLDYYWNAAPRDKQQGVLGEQLDLAAELGLPVVLHLREAKDAEHGDCASDLMKILEAWVASLGRRLERSPERSRRRPAEEGSRKSPLTERPGVLHSFSGSVETARRAIALNFYIGVTGPVTYRKSRQEVIAQLPLDRLLIESDAPFLAPHPYRGKRNEPAYVREIADKIAALKSRSQEEIAAATTTNARRLFSWGAVD